MGCGKKETMKKDFDCVAKSRVIISVACYHNDREVINYAKQIECQTCCDRLVLLITANEADDYNELLRCKEKLKIECHVYNAGVNLGYLNGCLYGVKQYGILNDCDKVVISNTDLLFKDEKAFSKILIDLEDDDVWCLGPSIQLMTGRYQNPFLVKRPRSTKVYAWMKIQGNALMLRFYTWMSKLKNNRVKFDGKGSSGYVYSVHGSFFAINKKCVLELMKVSNHVFMYGEELLVAEIVMKNAGKIFYDGDIHIVHNENSTTGLANAKVKALWNKQSLGFLYNTYFKE